MHLTSHAPGLSTKAARAADTRIPLRNIRAKLGHEPTDPPAAGGNYYYYTSPFRPQEKTPSFVVCEPKNV